MGNFENKNKNRQRLNTESHNEDQHTFVWKKCSTYKFNSELNLDAEQLKESSTEKM